MKTITLALPPDTPLEEFVEENGLVLRDGVYHNQASTPEALEDEERTKQAMAELGEAAAKLMGPYLERIGQQQIGTLLIGQGVFHLVNSGATITDVFHTVAIALDETGAHLSEEVTAQLMEAVNSEDGLTMVREDEDTKH